jgi:hypothetical protein
MLQTLKSLCLYLNLLRSCSTEISFDDKNQRKIVIFGNFEMSPCCRENRKLKIEHAITNDMLDWIGLDTDNQYLNFHNFSA